MVQCPPNKPDHLSSIPETHYGKKEPTPLKLPSDLHKLTVASIHMHTCARVRAHTHTLPPPTPLPTTQVIRLGVKAMALMIGALDMKAINKGSVSALRRCFLSEASTSARSG